MAVEAPERIWADEKFWPNVAIKGLDECWLWQSTKMGRGYGSIRPHGQPHHTGAHRVSWMLRNGRWPKAGEVVMHTCDNPACVNPEHLQIGDQKQNIRDCVSKGRHKPFVPPLKKACRNGHEFTEDNTEYVLSRGRSVRRCKTCHRAAAKRWEAKNV